MMKQFKIPPDDPIDTPARRAHQELIEMGLIVRILTLNPESGELEWRYCHKDRAPKPN